MRLRELVASVPGASVSGDDSIEVGGLAYRSDAVAAGDAFLCVRGFEADGHDFADDAVSRGAAALVCERPLGLGVPEAIVDDVRAAMGPMAAALHGDPTDALRVCGITGTNGKTTTAFLIRDLLEESGTRCGLLGTVKQVVAGREEPVERTTPEAVDLQATFARMRDGGDEACAMEVSSHALELGRVDGVTFDCAVFTNLTQDHLDFHADMEHYFRAKSRLFESGPRVAVVNADDPYGRRLAEAGPAVTYSARGAEADYRAHDVDFDAGGARFRCSYPGGEADVRIALPGDFNVANALAALAASASMGVQHELAIAALGRAGAVPGRFEPVRSGQPFAVYVDYAHTPDSLENVLDAARRLAEGRVICVFGCGGDRDRSKRPLMGTAAARRADVCIVTSDNPRSEPPEAIIGEILEGMAGSDPVVEPDRAEAISRAVAAARPGDVVVIAGKGHEQGQELDKGRRVPFDDREVALRALESLRSGADT